MNELSERLVEVVLGEHHVAVALTPPAMIDVYRQHAELAEDFALADESDADGYVFVAVGNASEWPNLVVTQLFQPSVPGFKPGILLVPHRRQLFIGAGTRLLAYHARSGRWQRCWIDDAELGFWQWRQHGDVVVMSAELELAAWTTDGAKLWTTFVEPPWSYRVEASQVVLDVMGSVRTFDLRTGR